MQLLHRNGDRAGAVRQFQICAALLKSELQEAARQTGELVWELPLWEIYHEKIKSDIADYKNHNVLKVDMKYYIEAMLQLKLPLQNHGVIKYSRWHKR